MTHLGERITDFMFKELSAEEMRMAERHLSECADCRQQVQEFQRTIGILKSSPGVEPPRRIVFEVEKPKRRFSWVWAAPFATAAAALLVLMVAAPVHVDWSDEQVTIAFGTPKAVPPSAPAQAVETAAGSVIQPVIQPVDYDRILREVKESQRTLIAAELRQRDAVHMREMQQLQGQFVYMDSVQRSLLRDTIENASSIQLLAQKDE